MTSGLVCYQDSLWAQLAESDQFGLKMLMLAGLPRRAFADGELRSAGPLVQPFVDPSQVERIAPLTTLLRSRFESEDSWLPTTRKAQQNLLAWLLISEDPQRRLVVQDVSPLMHQRSLVEHVLGDNNLSRVLIGDEVGLGKTVEAGLITQRLLASQPDLRVLYLAPARLVKNVAIEFQRLGIEARTWISGSGSDARVATDRVVIASINKSVFDKNASQLIAAAPWDLIIADECHHLSDYAHGGGSPNAGYRLVRDLVAGQRVERGRLLLLSGTPHQGNSIRFENLLDLLRREHETIADVAGRVIYRTKESIRDWEGRPLFPKRDVRPPRLARLGEAWMDWYARVGDLYDVRDTTNSGRVRAGGWAKGQALQWAASSVEAGLGYLVRLAIRRLRWDLSNPELSAALISLRPYRGGSIDESLPDLYSRLEKQIGAIESQEDAEELEDVEVAWQPDATVLAELLLRGTELKRNNADAEKWRVMGDLLREAGHEKVVLFCQPVETVGVVAKQIEAQFGVRCAIIIGGQSESERAAEIDRFRDRGGAQFIVSSKAGGEGLNLQISRRLLHLDIPWNPMDLEQRVGRVHRFGSRQTILVDTIVVPGTREADAYRVARDKLRLIADELDPEHFELLFSRVMNLVPPEELAAVFAAPQPLSPGDETENKIAAIVRLGYDKLSSFTAHYSDGARRLRDIDPGGAEWTDLREFLKRVCSAETALPGNRPIFSLDDDETVSSETQVQTLQVFNTKFVCDETDGLPCHDADGLPLPRLGMDSKLVMTKVRERLEDVGESSVGAVKLDGSLLGIADGRTSLLVFLGVQRLTFSGGIAEEKSLELLAYLVSDEGQYEAVDRSKVALVVRHVYQAERQARPMRSEPLLNALSDMLPALTDSARRISQGQEASQLAIWPISCFLATFS